MASTKRDSPAYRAVADLIRQFPNAPALTLAKRAYRENPELWPTLEACRSTVRTQLGVHGEKCRKNATAPRPPRQTGDAWRHFIDPPLVQLDSWAAVQINGPVSALVLSDIHFPFHDAEALEVALDHGLKVKVGMVLLNGDICDHHWGSKFETDPRNRDFPGEIRTVKKFLGGLRKKFGKRCRIVLKHGNHEERFDRYMRLKCPELLGVESFEWATIFALNEHCVELVKDKRPIRLGKLNVIHGHEYRFQISNPVNPARGFFLRAKSHVLGGHFHQASTHSEKDVEQKVVTTFSTGCLCNLHPEYAPLNNWGHGFAVVDVDKDGAFHVENLRIVKGKVW